MPRRSSALHLEFSFKQNSGRSTPDVRGPVDVVELIPRLAIIRHIYEVSEDVFGRWGSFSASNFPLHRPFVGQAVFPRLCPALIVDSSETVRMNLSINSRVVATNDHVSCELE